MVISVCLSEFLYQKMPQDMFLGIFNFRKFWLNGKRSYAQTNVSLSPLVAKVYLVKRQ